MEKISLKKLTLKKITISRLDLQSISGGNLLFGGASNAPDITITNTTIFCANKPCYSVTCPQPTTDEGGLGDSGKTDTTAIRNTDLCPRI